MPEAQTKKSKPVVEKMKEGVKKVGREVQSEVSKIPPTTDENLFASIAYAWALSVVMLVVKRDHEYIQFHARQGVVLFLGSLLGFIPVIGWLVAIACWIGMVVGFIMAWQGKRFEIPFAYKLSKHIKF